MNPEITRIIDQYLSGELSQEDKTIFEDRLSKSEELQRELALQRSIQEAAKRSAVRAQVRQTAKNHHLSNKMKWGGLGLGILLLAVVSTSLIVNSYQSKPEFTLSEVTALTEELEDQGPIDNLESEFFAWNANDTAFLSADGVLVSVPENAFLLNGKPYNDAAVIQWQEALDGTSIVKAGLSTTSNGELLETQGMFSFSAKTREGKQLTINPKIGVYVQVPVDEYKEGMQLFDGEKDANGMINWVKPKALEKIPLPLDMAQLDFYPPEYEAKLNELKALKDKKYRDSLYLSFEKENDTQSAVTIREAEVQEILVDQLKDEYVRLSYHIEYLDNNEINIVATAFMGDDDGILAADENKRYQSNVGNPAQITIVPNENVVEIGTTMNGEKPRDRTNEVDEIYTSRVFKKRFKCLQNDFNLSFYFDFQICSDNRCLPPQREFSLLWIGSNPQSSASTVEEGLDEAMPYIPPSSVLAFWKPKFNNTLLSTREFEARMKEIHRTCDKSVLDVYVRNLNKPMYELDKKVVAKGYPQFAQFADQKIGALNAKNPHLKGLEAFYDQAIEQLKKREKTLRAKETEKRNKWDQTVTSERQKEVVRTEQRNAQALNEEYTLNHKNVRKQLGRVLGATIYGDSPISNIDRFVRETTLARKTNEYYDPVTGKTAQIQYNEFSFTVTNSGKYKQLYAYLFPSQLNSYHRINGKDGSFSYPLNDAIIYDLALVGISENGYSYTQRTTLKGGDLGEIELDLVSEGKLDASIRQLNAKRGLKSFDVKQELRWLKTEQMNYVEQKRRTDEQKFRNEVRPKVYPCACDEFAIDSTKIQNKSDYSIRNLN